MASILVVGGYGAVGRHLAQELKARGHAVTIAGRRLAMAEQAARQLGVAARHLDLEQPDGWPGAVTGMEMVVLCVDPPGVPFPAFLFERGIHYVDISADDAHLRAIEALPPPRRSAALLSVGLAPGLSNILLLRAMRGLTGPLEARIGLLFGINDPHGDAGLAWTADAVFRHGQDRRPEHLSWGPPWGRRRMHPVPFGDQFALMRTIDNIEVRTLVGFDSRVATGLVFGLARLAAGNRRVSRAVAGLLQPFGLGSRVCGIVCEVRGRDGSRGWVRFLGEHESRTTARLTALMIGHVLAAGPPPGIWHSHQLLDADLLLEDVARLGLGTLAGLAP